MTSAHRHFSRLRGDARHFGAASTAAASRLYHAAALFEMAEHYIDTYAVSACELIDERLLIFRFFTGLSYFSVFRK